MHSTPVYHYPNSTAFPFEQQFDFKQRVKWLEHGWVVSVYASVLYVILVFGLKKYMENKPRYELRGLLIAWNVFLATFSILGTVRVLPAVLPILYNHGVTRFFCDNSIFETDKVYPFWLYWFTIFKLPELGDTIFIVLRKQELIFLHWYHHITVMMYCFAFLHYAPSTTMVFCGMNYFVHAIMYSYYALKAMRFWVPKQISMSITYLQIMQMFFGCIANYVAYSEIQAGRTCQVEMDNIRAASMMYFSYFVLFAHFFYKAYFGSSRKFVKKD